MASARSLLVLGVITSGEPDHGIAVLRETEGGQTVAARVGQDLGSGMTIEKITPDYVLLRVGPRLEKVRVGDELDDAAPAAYALPVAAAGAGLERHGDTVRISSAYREDLVRRQLPHVLLQAAAVPYYVNGQLTGFLLSSIDRGSLFEKIGFVDGDVVTSINGQRLSDVGRAIRVLQGLESDARAEVTFLRGGAEQTLRFVVQ